MQLHMIKGGETIESFALLFEVLMRLSKHGGVILQRLLAGTAIGAWAKTKGYTVSVIESEGERWRGRVRVRVTHHVSA